MRAVTVDADLSESPDSLGFSAVPRPTAGTGQVLIRVEAAGVNRADILQRQGTYPPPPGASQTLGLECAGTVVSVGPGTDPQWQGRAVAALVEGGAYAEYCVADADLLLDTEGRISHVVATALPEALATVWMILFHLGRLTTGQSIVVHGASGGIGSMALQVARWRGCRLIATAGSARKRHVVKLLGADVALDHSAPDLAEHILQATDGRGVDAVLDNLGPSAIDRTVEFLAQYGQILTIGTQHGRIGEINAAPLMSRQATVRFASLRRTPHSVKRQIMADVRRELWPEVLAGRIAPLIHSVHGMDSAGGAHRVMEAGGHMGKVVLARPDATPDVSGAHALSPYLTSEGRHS